MDARKHLLLEFLRYQSDRQVLRPLHSTATQRDLVVGATPRRIREMRVLHHRPGLAAVAAGRSMGEQTAVRQVDCLLTELLVVYGTCEN